MRYASSTLDDMTALFSWVPPDWRAGRSFWDPQLFLVCAPLAILCCLSLSKRWARFTDAPVVFALLYGLPFFLLTFQDSLGDSVQMTDIIDKRYYMSEPLATWVHYWLYRLLHEPFNVGAKFAIALSGRLAGLVYLWAVARQSLRLFPELSPSRRLLYRLLFFTPGVALLFYGYVENTPLELPAEALWVLASIGFLQTPTLFNLLKCGAALALATALHGRAAFLAPALLFGSCIPKASIETRLGRATIAGITYFGLLALLVAYILLFDSRNVSGGTFGNALGGGNGRMFVPVAQLLDKTHWLAFLGPLFLAGGILAPCGLLAALTAPFKRDPILLWAIAYLLCDGVYIFFWEFDYGLLLDWDLVFSGVCPVILLAGIFLVRSKIPPFVVLPFLLGSVFLSMAYASIVNYGPLTLNVVPRAGSPVPETVCTQPGLWRTYFSDRELTIPVGPGEPNVPIYLYGPDATPFPTGSQPFGGVFAGYVKIPSSGRYRFVIWGQGNLRLRIADRTLYDRWTGLEWRITSEREMRFSEAGWYPMRLEFFSTASTSGAHLAIESAGQEKRVFAIEDLCH